MKYYCSRLWNVVKTWAIVKWNGFTRLEVVSLKYHGNNKTLNHYENLLFTLTTDIFS